jgi:DNA mismatch endonuclease (patch repair protein)
MDVFTRRERSRIMSRIRSRGNMATELRLIQLMRAHKITGWRRSQKLPGNPDFVFRRKLLVVFVDGCFWHGCPQCYRLPKSRITYWRAKVHGNMKRDIARRAALRRLGWSVIKIWEHQLKAKPQNCVERIKQALISRGLEKSKAR